MSNNFKTSLDLTLRFLLYFLNSLMKPNNKTLNINFSQTIETFGSLTFPAGAELAERGARSLPTQYSNYRKFVRKYILHS